MAHFLWWLQPHQVQQRSGEAGNIMIRKRDSGVVVTRRRRFGWRSRCSSSVSKGLCLKLMSATSGRRVGLEARPKHANTFQTTSIPPPHDDTTTTIICTAAPYSRIQPIHDQLCSLDYAVKAKQARHQRASEQPTLIHETRHTHALSGLLSIPHASHATTTTYDLCT
jgi:hypothetical protein